MESDLPNPDHPKLDKTHEGEHHEDFGASISSDPLRLTNSTILYAACASLNSCNLGYDIGVSTEAGRLIQDAMGLTKQQRELFTGSINFFAMFGAFFAYYFTDNFGRRRTFIIAAIGFIVGIVIQASSQSYKLLMFGRAFVGLGVGTGLAIDPLYIAEITPAKFRGELVTWSEISINIGLVFGFSTGLFLPKLDNDVEWRVMFLLGAILPVVMIIVTLKIMPESPRWLVQKGRSEEAKHILQKTYPPGFDVDVLVEDISEALEREQEAEHAVGWGVFLHPTPAFRRMILLGIFTVISQQLVGIDAVQYYLLDIISNSGIDSREKQSVVLVLLGLLKLLFVVIGGKLFDRSGRRKLMFISLIGMAGALLLVSISFWIEFKASTSLIMIGMAMYLAFFSVGTGPGSWLIPAEIFALCIRGKAMSVAAFCNRVAATIMSTTFLSIADDIGWGGFFFALSITSLAICGTMYIYLPETKGRSIEDMSRFFAEQTNDMSVLEAEAKVRRRHEFGSAGEGGGLEDDVELSGRVAESTQVSTEEKELV